jgi:two-component system, chemotaxis family, chemotaxis protein CheY
VRPARRVLVIDDDEPIRELLGAMLADEGYEVATAANGADALQMLDEQGLPDLILLDIVMPIVDGRQFAAEYHQRSSPRAPIVVISASKDPQEAAEQIRAGGWIAKPFDVDELLQLVARYAGSAGNRSPTAMQATEALGEKGQESTGGAARR